MGEVPQGPAVAKLAGGDAAYVDWQTDAGGDSGAKRVPAHGPRGIHGHEPAPDLATTCLSAVTHQEPQAERRQTDESLRNERCNADEALAAKRSAEESADNLVARARSKADAVLDNARNSADDMLSDVGSVVEDLHHAVAMERAQEDATLKQERAAADERLCREREARAAMLEALVSKERTNTDRYLLMERGRSDDAIAHRDDFLGMVSHDLRNLLNSVSLKASILAAQAPDSGEGRRTVEVLSRVQRDITRMERIISDLVDVVSIEGGKLSIRPENSDAVPLLHEVVESFSESAKAKTISLSIVPGANPRVARFDRQRIFQVIANLLSNAIKFTSSNGKVTLLCEHVGGNLHFSVCDTGSGIPSEVSEAVFERFWQVGEDDRRGLGMGLYIAKCIVEGHGGRIWVDSTVGKGSSFHFTIPLHPPS